MSTLGYLGTYDLRVQVNFNLILTQVDFNCLQVETIDGDSSNFHRKNGVNVSNVQSTLFEIWSLGSTKSRLWK